MGDGRWEMGDGRTVGKIEDRIGYPMVTLPYSV